jgi:GH25 family lysozyme M1 (1,4-beta-N-acetylmuramidase)
MSIFSKIARAVQDGIAEARARRVGDVPHEPERCAAIADVPHPLDAIAVGLDPAAVRGPFCGVDLYHGDLGARPDFDALVAARSPRWHWAILKATQGVAYPHRGWFITNWDRVKAAAGARYGQDFFRGAYVYLNFHQSGKLQADHYLKTVDDAGGWDDGDMLPILDVERGQPSSANYGAKQRQVEDVVGAAALRLKQSTGRRVMLYGRGAMRDLGITSKMGCDVAWNPAYTSRMPSMKEYGFPLDDVVMWQYAGSETVKVPLDGYTNVVPKFGRVDANVFLDGARPTTLASLRERLLR